MMQSFPEWSRRCRFLQYSVASIALLATDLLPASAPGATLTDDVQPIFDTYCVVCHMHGSASGELILEDGEARAQLLNRQSTQSSLTLVEPFKADSSYLVFKLRGTHAEVGGSGLSMPPDSAGLSENQLKTIVDWINAGAPE